MTAKLETWTKNYSQDGDCWSSEPQDIIIEQQDGGGGAYWIITTERWAFNSIDEVVALLREAGVRQAPPTEVVG